MKAFSIVLYPVQSHFDPYQRISLGVLRCSPTHQTSYVEGARIPFILAPHLKPLLHFSPPLGASLVEARLLALNVFESTEHYKSPDWLPLRFYAS